MVIFKLKKFYFTLCITIALFGCSTVYRPADIFTNENIDSIYESGCPNCSPLNIATQIQRRMFEERISQINPYKFKVGEKILYEKATGTEEGTSCNRKKENKVLTGELGSREIARNELIGTAIMLADSSISKHLGGIKSSEVNFNLLLGAATAGLTGGASVAGEVGARTLSAAATGTNAARGIFNETTFRNALSETLIGAIQTNQIVRRNEIFDKLVSECISTYPVSIALSDVQNYLSQGSFYHGLALIREAAELANSKRRGKDILLEDPLAKLMYQNLILDQEAKAAAREAAKTSQEKGKTEEKN